MVKVIAIGLALLSLIMNAASRPRHILLSVAQISLLYLVSTIESGVLVLMLCWMIVSVTTNVSRLGDSIEG